MSFTTDDIDNALTTVQKNVIKECISSIIFDGDMINRLQWAYDEGYPDVLIDKYNNCIRRMKKKWESVLIEDEVDPIPTDQDEFAALVLAHQDYKDRADRDEEARLALEELD